MQTRTRNAIAVVVLLAAAGLCAFAIGRNRTPPALRARSLDSVPAGALVVAVADLDALRGSPLGPKLLARDRDIPGLGKVSEVCGFDPMEHVHEVAIVVPAGDDTGDFGLVASGEVPDEQILACAAKVIEQRGGHPIVTNVGSFRTVRDSTMLLSGAEIAVKKGGPVLLGAGAYLRAMIDATDGLIPTIQSSVAHARLGAMVQGSVLRATIVLTPKQREDLAQNLADQGGPRSAASIVAGALGASVGSNVSVHAVIACEDAKACADVAAIIVKARDARAADLGTKIVGFSQLLEATTIQAQGETVQIRAELPADQAATLLERFLILRGARHPMPRETAQPAAPDAPANAADAGASDAGPQAPVALPPPDEVLTAKGDAGVPPADAGARDAGHDAKTAPPAPAHTKP